MRKIIQDLVAIANEIDKSGLFAQAKAIDSVIKSLANAPQESFAIEVVHHVTVDPRALAKYDFPDEIPEQYQKKVESTITVSKREGYNVGEALDQKSFSSKNLSEARGKTDPLKDKWKTLYSPSTSDEQLFFN